MTKNPSLGAPRAGTSLLRSATLFIAALSLALPVHTQTDTKRARESFIAIQHQVDTVEERAVKSTVALQLGGVSGSGVIISPEGYVLTAPHVVAARRNRPCTVILSDGRRLLADILASNKEDDFALIKIQDPKDLTVSPLGDSSALRPGEWVLATGHPLGLHAGRPPVLRIGRVMEMGGRRRSSGRLVRDGRRIFTDAPLISGDSGGPLFDLEGRVVGINSMITEGDRWLASIHVPANLPKGVLDKMEKGEDPTDDDVQNAPIRKALSEAEGALRSDDVDAALKAAARGAELDPTSAVARVLLARANARAGKDAAAVAALQQAVGRGFVDSAYLRDDPDLGRLRGQAEFQKLLARIDTVSGIPGSRKGDRPILAAASTAGPAFGRGVVGVLSGGTQVTLGTVMSPDGDVLTKASELPEGPLACSTADGRTLSFERGPVDTGWDVALLKVKGANLSTVPVNPKVELGHWTFTPDASGGLAALGVVGVADMPVHGQGIAPKPTSKAYMGVSLNPVRPAALEALGLKDGVVVDVQPGTPADKAGIQTGDIFYEVDGKPAKDPDGVMDILLGKKPGDNLTVRIAREKERLSVTVNLTTRPAGLPGRGGLAEMLSGEVSRKAGPFPRVLHHDAVLPPKAMGGPVLDADGKLVGLNIARADRTSTYAIPAKELSEIYAKLKAGK